MKRLVNIWLKIWILVMMAAGTVFLFLLVFYWNDLALPEKLVMALATALPLHVLEENVIPGGFFYPLAGVPRLNSGSDVDEWLNLLW